jgi:hypothetical protein
METTFGLLSIAARRSLRQIVEQERVLGLILEIRLVDILRHNNVGGKLPEVTRQKTQTYYGGLKDKTNKGGILCYERCRLTWVGPSARWGYATTCQEGQYRVTQGHVIRRGSRRSALDYIDHSGDRIARQSIR